MLQQELAAGHKCRQQEIIINQFRQPKKSGLSNDKFAKTAFKQTKYKTGQAKIVTLSGC